jgi:acyl-CoA synthetase (AMP-forming)/AMP-acid ligase II
MAMSMRGRNAGTHWLIQRLRGCGQRPALIWRDQTWSYGQLCDAADVWFNELTRRDVRPGNTLAICGDYSPRLCALLIAALLNRNIVVPLAAATARRWNQMMDVAEVEFVIEFGDDDRWRITELDRKVTHPLLRQLIERGAPGLILFSSGSTGQSKASALDFDKLLEKFHSCRPAHRTLAFLLLDHIGGINTLCHVLCHGGTLVPAQERTPEAVCSAIEKHHVQLLPTTPTFLRMLLISDVIKRHDLSSLEIVTYGTEPMPTSTLAAIREALPAVRFKQTYGLSELGIMPTQSRSSDSLWLKLGSAGFEHRIVDGVLWLRSESGMLGYLNAPSPFNEEGWFNTQDVVEVEGDYVRIIGRKSELINVGGEKVHPTEIENVLLQLENVRDATVFAKPNAVTGQVVGAKITPVRAEDPEAFKQRIRAFCRARLERFKVPVAIEIMDADHHGDRFKKVRSSVEC